MAVTGKIAVMNGMQGSENTFPDAYKYKLVIFSSSIVASTMSKHCPRLVKPLLAVTFHEFAIRQYHPFYIPLQYAFQFRDVVIDLGGSYQPSPRTQSSWQLSDVSGDVFPVFAGYCYLHNHSFVW